MHSKSVNGCTKRSTGQKTTSMWSKLMAPTQIVCKVCEFGTYDASATTHPGWPGLPPREWGNFQNDSRNRRGGDKTVSCVNTSPWSYWSPNNKCNVYIRRGKMIHDEVWLHAYRFKVKKGVRLVDISLRNHITSHMKIDGHRALISYKGQPMTCYRCSEQGHKINDFPRRKLQGKEQTNYGAN